MVCEQGGLSELRRGGRTFGGQGLQGQPYGYSVSNIFEDSFNEEVTGEGNYIFELGFKFLASKERKNLNSIASEERGLIGD